MTQPSAVKYYTPQEVAEHLRVSTMTVYRLIHAEALPAVRIGRSFRIPAQGLVSYVRDNLHDEDLAGH